MILIDPPVWPAHGRLWAHLVSDESFDELHAFARSVGIPERAFERDHYDVPAEHHAALVAAGARPVRARELVERLSRNGLRRPKGRPAPSAHGSGSPAPGPPSAGAPPGR